MNNEISPDNQNPIVDISAVPSIEASAEDMEALGVPVSQAKSKTNINKAGIYAMIAVFVLASLLLLIYFTKKSLGEKEATKTKEKAEFTVKNDAVDNDTIKKKQLAIMKAQASAKAIDDARIAEEMKQAEAKKQAEALAVAAAVAPTQNNAVASNGQPAVAGQANKNAPVVRPETPYQRKLKGDVLFEVEQTSNKESALDKGVAKLDNFAANGQPQQNQNNAIANSLQPTVLASRRAGRLGNLDYLLKRNTSIPCALKTGIDTTLAGFVVCEVTNDVYSANGHTLLVERGAEISGEQQSTLKQGQARTFVLWTRIDNPSGVYANLDSPATDMMGYNGLDGFVDRHFWERFGGAIMISFIKDFSQVLVNKSSPDNNNSSISFNNSQRATESMAVETLKNSINIPPTLTVNPATVVNVLLARDVSFESVYTVEQ